MFDSIWDDIKSKYYSGNTLIRIIMLNIAVFLIVLFTGLILQAVYGFGSSPYNNFLEFFMISKNGWHNLTHPWTIISYMFLHESFWHIFWNMVVLYWFGNIVGDLMGDRVVLPTYLLSGIAGGLVYFICGYLPIPWNIGMYALGASAAVNGFMMLAASKFPNYGVSIPFIGPVRIKYIVAIFLIIDLVSIRENSNTGGHFAHLGGAATGWFIVYLLENHRIDLIRDVNRILDAIAGFFSSIFAKKAGKTSAAYGKKQKQEKSRSQSFVVRKPRENTRQDTTQSDQERIDSILDKIKISGYENLTAEEKDFLYKASKE